MKNLVPLIMLFSIMISCATSKNQEQLRPTSPYLEPGQIYAFLDAFNEQAKTKKATKSITEESWTEQEQERLKNLIKPGDLYSKEFSAYRNQNALKSKSATSYKADYTLHPEGVDLREHATPVKAQDNGKCTAYAGTGSMEIVINQFKKVPSLDLSDWDAWDKYGVYSCDSFMRALSQPKNKICNEVDWPQYGRWTKKCSDTAYAYISNYKYLGQDTNEIIRALNEKHPVYIGMSTPNDIVRCKPVVDPNNGFARGGHAMVLVGYLPPKSPKAPISDAVVIVRNSWGADCADKGYHYMPISIFKRNGHDSAYWEIIEVNTNGDVVPPTPQPEPECKKWVRVWYAPWKFRCVEGEGKEK